MSKVQLRHCKLDLKYSYKPQNVLSLYYLYIILSNLDFDQLILVSSVHLVTQVVLFF